VVSAPNASATVRVRWDREPDKLRHAYVKCLIPQVTDAAQAEAEAFLAEEDPQESEVTADLTQALRTLRSAVDGQRMDSGIATAFRILDNAGLFAQVDAADEPIEYEWRYEATRYSFGDDTPLGQVFGYVTAASQDEAITEIMTLDGRSRPGLYGYLAQIKVARVN
jgi:hypothetical protein